MRGWNGHPYHPEGPYAATWNGRPLPATRAPINSLGAYYEPTGDWPPVISPGAPEAGFIDALAPLNGLVETVKANPLLAIGAAAAIYLLVFRKKKGSGNLVGRSLRLKSIA